MTKNKLKQLIREEIRLLLNESSRSILHILPSGPRPRYKSWAKNFSEWKNGRTYEVVGLHKNSVLVRK